MDVTWPTAFAIAAAVGCPCGALVLMVFAAFKYGGKDKDDGGTT